MRIHARATIARAMSADTSMTAMFCQTSKLPEKKARNRITKASQLMPVVNVTAILETIEFMA